MVAQDSKRRVTLIMGIIGQDGKYPAEYLLGLGYTVHRKKPDHPRSTRRVSINLLPLISLGLRSYFVPVSSPVAIAYEEELRAGSPCAATFLLGPEI